MVFFIESCFSGGMFGGIDPSLNIYASTSSSTYHTSSFWYCGATKYNSSSYGTNVVNGKSIGSCLSGEFSAFWMENADVTNLNHETLN